MPLSNNPFHKGDTRNPNHQAPNPDYFFQFWELCTKFEANKNLRIGNPFTQNWLWGTFCGFCQSQTFMKLSESHDPKQLVVGLYKRYFLWLNYIELTKICSIMYSKLRRYWGSILPKLERVLQRSVQFYKLKTRNLCCNTTSLQNSSWKTVWFWMFLISRIWILFGGQLFWATLFQVNS